MPTTRRNLLRAGLGVAIGTTLAGCSSGDGDSGGATTTAEPTTTAAPTTTGPTIVANEDATLSVEHVRFSSSRPDGYRDYDAMDPQAIDPSLSSVYVYHEPAGIPVIETDAGDREVRAELRTRVISPDSSSLLDTTDDLEYTLAADEDPTGVWFTKPLTPPDSPADGTFTLELTVTDRVTGRSDTASTNFAYRRPTPTATPTTSDYLEQFRASVVERGMSVEVLNVEDGRLNFEYSTSNTPDSQTFLGNVAYTAGVFTGLIARGLEAEAMLGLATADNGSQYVWAVGRSDAMAFLQGDIDEDTFRERVLESIQRV